MIRGQLFFPAFGAQHSVTLSNTGAAIPPTLPIFPSVGCIVGMPLRTVRFHPVPRSVYLRRQPSLNVHLLSDRLQVSGIDAMAHSAEMVNREPRLDRADEKLISKAVCTNIAPAGTELPISIAACGPGPKPARTKIGTIGWNRPVLINLGPKASLGSRSRVVNTPVESPTGVVHPTPAPRQHSFFTSKDGTGRLWSHREFTPLGVMRQGVLAPLPPSILPRLQAVFA